MLERNKRIKNLKPEDLAEVIYKKLYDLKIKNDSNFEYSHHPKEFLPANVCCDFVGMTKFKNYLTNIIKEELEK